MEYRAEIFDQFQLLYEATGFNDHQLHCVLRFASGLDADVLRKAVVASVEAIPILGSRYIDDVQRPRWESIDPSRFGEAFLLARTEGEFNEFVTSRIEESRGPQVRACLLGVSPFALALCMNHMVCDAAGFKEFLYFLCDIYSKLASGFDCRPIMTTGDRGIAEVLRRFSVVAKLKSLILQSAENNRCGARRFPLSEGRDTRPFILTRKLGGERSAALQVYCKARGVTLNDAVLTAYYRCLFRRLAIPPGTELRIPLMVDMRRYLKTGSGFRALRNLTSTVITRLTYMSEEKFADTLERIKTEMGEKKSSNIGLNGFVKLSLLFRLSPKGVANRRLRAGLKNPLICMTNVGILDSARLSFASVRPCDAFMCGSIKYKPHFQLALSSYGGGLTFSSNLYGDERDRELVLTFMDEIAAELPNSASMTTQQLSTAGQPQTTSIKIFGGF